MKKVIIALLILCFVLTGCNNQTNSTSSIEADSNSDSDASELKSSSNNSVSSNPTQETYDDDGACGMIQYHAKFKTVEDFISWAKNGGDKRPNLSKSYDNPCSAFFFYWRKNKSKMVLPKLVNNNFELKYIKAEDNQLFFGYRIKKDLKKTTDHNSFHIHAFPLTEQQKNANLAQLADLFDSSIMIVKKNVQGKWGNYYIGKHLETRVPCVWFVNSSMLYLVNAINFDDENEQGEWQEEYFDYFDFETVSLK